MKKTPMIWMLRRIRRRIPALGVLTLLQAGHAFLAVLFALGSRGVIDAAVAGHGAAFRTACLYQGAIILLLIVSQVLARHLRDRLAMDLERDWKKDILHGLLRGEYAAVSAYHSAELLNRLGGDVRRVNEGILTILPSALSMVTRLVAAVAVLGALDGRFTAIMILGGLVLICATALMRRHLKTLNKQVAEQDGKVSGFLQETIEKLLMVQAMDVAPQMEQRAEKLLDDRYAIQRKRKNMSLITGGGVSLMYYGAGFLALCYCAGQMLAGAMSFGSLTAVIQLVSQLQSPFMGLSGLGPQYAAMAASAERLMELEDIPAQEEGSLDAAALYESMTAIGAEELTFSYDRDRVLEQASFRLPKGAFAVVTGQSGMGKSTLLKLLLGIFPPEQGQLYVQTREGRVALSRKTRGLFAYVPQGNLLLSGTLRENLTVVKPEAAEEELQQALWVSGMEEFLPTLPQGLDTVLGENGAGLSEGQAQRLAIARAVLGGAPILLLDECTSALDAQTEAVVLQRLESLGRTCIAVTHKPAAKAQSQWQLDLREGQITVTHREKTHP